MRGQAPEISTDPPAHTPLSPEQVRCARAGWAAGHSLRTVAAFVECDFYDLSPWLWIGCQRRLVAEKEATAAAEQSLLS